MDYQKGDSFTEINTGREGSRPLQGRSVVITRARGQSEEMTALLEKLGAQVLHCPTIEIVEPDDWGPLDTGLKDLEQYDWIIFTSANAVRFFLRRLAERRSEGVSATARLVTCAIGPATAKALNGFGARVDVVAADSSSEGVLAAIARHVGGGEKLKGLRFLIPRSSIARDLLPMELTRFGARVSAVEAYRTLKPSAESEEILRLIEKGSVDAITFTSPSTVANFASMAGPLPLPKLLEKTLIACIGPVTTAAAVEQGLTNIVQPEVHTTAALAFAIAEAIGETVK